MTFEEEWTLKAIVDDLLLYFKPLDSKESSYERLKNWEMRGNNLSQFITEYLSLAARVKLETKNVTESEIVNRCREKLAHLEEGCLRLAYHLIDNITLMPNIFMIRFRRVYILMLSLLLISDRMPAQPGFAPEILILKNCIVYGIGFAPRVSLGLLIFTEALVAIKTLSCHRNPTKNRMMKKWPCQAT